MHWTEYVEIAVVAWPSVTAVATAIWKPRDPEGWARLSRVAAAVWKFVGSTGFDTPKALKALKEFRDGHQPEEKQIQVTHNGDLH